MRLSPRGGGLCAGAGAALARLRRLRGVRGSPRIPRGARGSPLALCGGEACGRPRRCRSGRALLTREAGLGTLSGQSQCSCPGAARRGDDAADGLARAPAMRSGSLSLASIMLDSLGHRFRSAGRTRGGRKKCQLFPAVISSREIESRSRAWAALRSALNGVIHQTRARARLTCGFKKLFLGTARVRGGEVGRLCSSGFRARSVNFFPGGSPAVVPLFDLFLTFSHFFLTGPHTCCLTLPSGGRVGGAWTGGEGRPGRWIASSRPCVSSSRVVLHLVDSFLTRGIGRRNSRRTAAARDALTSVADNIYRSELRAGQCRFSISLQFGRNALGPPLPGRA